MEFSPGKFFRKQTPDPERAPAHNALIGKIADYLRGKYPGGVPSDIQSVAEEVGLPAETVNFGDLQEAIKRAQAITPK